MFLAEDEQTHFVVSIEAAKQCAACTVEAIQFHVPAPNDYNEDIDFTPIPPDDVQSTDVPVFVVRAAPNIVAMAVEFLEGPENIGNASQFLAGCELELLRCANILQTPLLFIYCAGHMYDMQKRQQELHQELMGSFMLGLSIEEWHKLEVYRYYIN